MRAIVAHDGFAAHVAGRWTLTWHPDGAARSVTDCIKNARLRPFIDSSFPSGGALANPVCFHVAWVWARAEAETAHARRALSSRFFLLVLFLGTGLWTWLTLPWAYSDGTRSGVLQKFSRRGWICKTREGDLALYSGVGVSPQIWQFSVRDPRLARSSRRTVGARVQVHYTEHPGIPSTCFADTRYFVDRVTVMDRCRR